MSRSTRKGALRGALVGATLVALVAIYVFVRMRGAPEHLRGEWLELAGVGLMVVGFPTSLLGEIAPTMVGNVIILISPVLNLAIGGAIVGWLIGRLEGVD